MDMKKILTAFNNAAAGNHKSPASVADMKKFVSIVKGIPTVASINENIHSFDEDTIGGNVNNFLIAADKINDEVMGQIDKIKINADPTLLKELMDRFNAFLSAYHAVGKEILQPDMFKDSMGEGLSFKDYATLAEAKKKNSTKEDPCWNNYKMVGTKNKNGKEVPNCVPDKKGS